MNLLRLLPTTVFFFLLGLRTLGAGPADAIVEKARAFIGSERVINALTSLHFTGTLVASDGVSGTIDLVFQKPKQYRVVQVLQKNGKETKDTYALDDFDGWERKEDTAHPDSALILLLPPAEIRRLQANTFENLYYYRGIEQRGGRVEYRGEAKIDGRDAVKVAFIHVGGIVFVRTFEKKTGRLILTETDRGDQIREDGEIVVDGMRFPQRVVSTGTGRDGKKITFTIAFSAIRVNEKTDPSIFAVPVLTPR